MRNTKKALTWIVRVLRKYKVSFQISGGFAARAYGATRELADIDIYIPNKAFDKTGEAKSALKMFHVKQ